MVSMMQEVLRSGTGAGVRAHGFTLPAAGKDGNLARWMVRRLYQRVALRGVGGVRR